MAEEAARRTRRGAPVTCSDRPLGHVIALEQPDGEMEQFLRVAPDDGGEDLLIPMRLIGVVDPDGAVHLNCTHEQIEHWADAPAPTASAAPPASAPPAGTPTDAEVVGTLHLHEEQLVPHKELTTVGEVQVRTVVEEAPEELTVDAVREEVEVEHVPVGTVVNERKAPWEEDGALVIPVYEEQLVLVKRLVLREHLRVRRLATTEARHFADTVRRERVVIDDPSESGLVHETYPAGAEVGGEKTVTAAPVEGSFFGQLVRRFSGDEAREERR